MKEYIVSHNGKWWHFFMKPFYGLCFRKKEGGRFSPFEVLLSEACEDFCATCDGEKIHLVCQNQNGSILYLCFADNTWRKTILLENKNATPYPKHFRLVPMGGFINLFYIIAYKEKYMLVHQVITAENRPPTVVDRITPHLPLFSVSVHTGTDIAILYENESGTTGTRLYRWSQKNFSRFVPVAPAENYMAKTFLHEKQDKVRYGGLQKINGVDNLIYFEKNNGGDCTPAQTIYLDCPADANPIFSKDGEKLYLVWQEGGGIMSANSADDGKTWSKPIRYMIPAGSSVVCYGIAKEGLIQMAYGYAKEQEIVLYGTLPLEDLAITPAVPQYRLAGQEVVDFAKENNGLKESDPLLPPDPVLMQIRQELANLKEQIFTLRARLAKLANRLEDSPLPLTQEDITIDEILLKNEMTTKQKNIKQS